MPERRLAAVMVTDMVGFTAIMGADQEHALELLGRAHATLRSIAADFQGELLEDAGDRSLTAFPSAVNAVRCALEIQSRLKDDPELKLRIGVDMGDILRAGGHVYGDTVNVASFIERLADPEGLVITQSIFEAVSGQIELNVQDLGEKVLKNVGHPVRLYALTGAHSQSPVAGFVSGLFARRVPQITGAYLAAGWALVEVTEWLALQGALDRRWIYAVAVGLIAFLPSVVLITYTHGAHGRERFSSAEKVGLPLNLLLTAMLVAVTYQNVQPPAGEPGAGPISPASIAVLPFVSFGADQADQYFGAGLSEELINALALVPGLHVASRTSSFMFDSNEEDPRSIARKLRVATLLEGSVRRQGRRIRVTAQLIDGMSNSHIFSKTYDRELADIFEIQEDIARTVAAEIVGILQPTVIAAIADARAGTLEAYDFYLQGLAYLRQPASAESLESARTLFMRSLAEDADYARAWAGLCEVSLEQFVLSNAAESIDRAEADCRRALDVGPNLREVRFAVAEMYRRSGDYEASADMLRRLLDERQSADVWSALGQTNEAAGDFAAAENSYRNAIDMEPGNWRHRMALAEFLYWQGRYPEGVEEFRRVIELSPDNGRAWLLMGACLDYMGDIQASLSAILKSIEISPTRGAYRDLGLTYYYLGDYEKATEAYETAVELGPDDHWSWGNLAQIYLFLDDHEQAQQALDRAIALAEALLRRNDRDWVTLARLASYNVNAGNIEEGVKTIRTAVAGGGHLSEVHFYDAIIHMQLGQREEALGALERAVELGSPLSVIEREPLFADLNEDDRFRRLIGER